VDILGLVTHTANSQGTQRKAPGGGNTTERLHVIDEERLLPAPYHRSLLRTGEQVVVS
jgi:hypothetical protein